MHPCRNPHPKPTNNEPPKPHHAQARGPPRIVQPILPRIYFFSLWAAIFLVWMANCRGATRLVSRFVLLGLITLPSVQLRFTPPGNKSFAPSSRGTAKVERPFAVIFWNCTAPSKQRHLAAWSSFFVTFFFAARIPKNQESIVNSMPPKTMQRAGAGAESSE